MKLASGIVRVPIKPGAHVSGFGHVEGKIFNLPSSLAPLCLCPQHFYQGLGVMWPHFQGQPASPPSAPSLACSASALSQAVKGVCEVVEEGGSCPPPPPASHLPKHRTREVGRAGGTATESAPAGLTSGHPTLGSPGRRPSTVPGPRPPGQPPGAAGMSALLRGGEAHSCPLPRRTMKSWSAEGVPVRALPRKSLRFGGACRGGPFQGQDTMGTNKQNPHAPPEAAAWVHTWEAVAAGRTHPHPWPLGLRGADLRQEQFPPHPAGGGREGRGSGQLRPRGKNAVAWFKMETRRVCARKRDPLLIRIATASASCIPLPATASWRGRPASSRSRGPA